MNIDAARKIAQAEIARRAFADGKDQFAYECLNGAWDEKNREDIQALVLKLMKTPWCLPIDVA